MLKRITTCLLCFFLLVIEAYAQDNSYTILVENDKKVLNIDKLGLSKSATILDVLLLLPDFLTRDEELLLQNYEIKVEDFNLSDAYISTLSQIRAEIVDRIEISESPVKNFRTNGQGGSINIILKKLDEGVSGEASLSAFSSLTVSPNVIMGYKKGNFTLRGLAKFSYYRPHDVTSFIQGYNDGEIARYTKADTSNIKTLNESVRLIMEYRPSEFDVFKLRMSQYYSKNDTEFISDINQGSVLSHRNDNTIKNKFGIDFNGDWVHKFSNRSSVELEMNYNASPQTNVNIVEELKTLESDSFNNSISGNLEYSAFLTPEGQDNFSKLIVGAGTNMTQSERYDDITYDSSPNEGSIVNSVVHTWFLSPYVKSDSKIGNWRLKAELQYQFFNYNVRGVGNERFLKHRGDLTGRVLLGWQVSPHNHLQLKLDRKLERPAGSMLYPYPTYNTDTDRFEIGNPDLCPLIINEAALGYITDITSGPHSLVLNAELSYMHVSNLFSAVKKTPTTTRDYYTYVNSGVNNIIAGKLTTIYKVGPLSLSLTGNIFDNHKIYDDSTDDYVYFNLSLFPTLNFKRGWSASSKLTYYSQISSSETRIGDATMLMLSVGKAWKHLNVSLSGITPIGGQSVDIEYQKGMTLCKTYWFEHPYAGIVVNYHF